MGAAKVAWQSAEGRRGWLSHGLAALAVSALGLGVAASVSLTTSAQPVSAPAPVAMAQVSQASGTVTASAPGNQTTNDAAADQKLAAFTRAQAVENTSRSADLQAAVVKERAAQRAEDLAKSAEELGQAARDAGGAARSQELASTEQATRQAAVKIAQQRLAEAVRNRVSAEQSTDTTDSSLQADSSDVTVSAGGGSASPVPGAVVGARFGQYGSWSRYHTGLDFRAGFGTPIKAVADGVVLYAGNSGDWAGNHVAIRHAGNVTTMSSHMSSMAVQAGQSVKAGQVIGYVGSTGRSFGPHLHFELYPAGVKYGDVYRAVNPSPWLRSIGVNVN
ncbi:MAG: M23 family metallopeptidase [Microlunatus sp.]